MFDNRHVNIFCLKTWKWCLCFLGPIPFSALTAPTPQMGSPEAVLCETFSPLGLVAPEPNAGRALM